MDPIDPNKAIRAIAKPDAAKVPSTKGKPSFDAVFKKRLEATHVQPAAAESSMQPSGVHPAQFAVAPQPSDTVVIDQIQNLIDTMDAYRERLVEKGTVLKEVAPLVQQMESQSETLSAASESAGGQDTSLQEMIDQSLMLSTLEISKFRSGCYNDG